MLIDNATHEVIGRHSTLTTHSDGRGVAAGVVFVFREVRRQTEVDPSEIVFIAHSTTQATNALLEGDVARVGIVVLSTRMEALLARRQRQHRPHRTCPGRFLEPAAPAPLRDNLDAGAVATARTELKAEGMQVVVASGVLASMTWPGSRGHGEATAQGLAATGGHEIPSFTA